MLQIVGEDRIVFASDYPHERYKGEFYGDIDELSARKDLSDTHKQKVLYANADRFYNG